VPSSRCRRASAASIPGGAGRRQLGGGIEQPRYDQRERQPPPLRAARQEPLQPEPPGHAQRRESMAVGQRAHDLEARAPRHQRVAAQHRAQ